MTRGGRNERATLLHRIVYRGAQERAGQWYPTVTRHLQGDEGSTRLFGYAFPTEAEALDMAHTLAEEEREMARRSIEAIIQRHKAAHS